MAKVAPAPGWYKHALRDQPFPHGKTVLHTPEDVAHDELFHTNRLGLKLCVQRWRRKDHLVTPPVACVVCLHGLNTHAGYTFASWPDYSYHGSVIESFVNRGFVVYCPDHQGHGKSERVKDVPGNVRSFDDIAHDQKLILRDVVRRDYPDPDAAGPQLQGSQATADKAATTDETKQSSTDGAAQQRSAIPVFLYGHCMGGAYVLRALQLKPDLLEGGVPAKVPRDDSTVACAPQGSASNSKRQGNNVGEFNHQLAGVILSAPTWRLAEASKPSSCVLGMLACLAGCAPKMIVANWPDAPTENTKFEDFNVGDMRFYTDPWCTPEPFTAHYAHQLNVMYQALEKSGNSVCGPVLLLQGDADTYVPASDTDMLWNDICNTSDKTYVTFEGMEHNVMYEPGCELVMKVIGEWIEARLPMRKTADSTSGKDIGGRYGLRPPRNKGREQQRSGPKYVAELQAHIFDRDTRLAALTQRKELEIQRQQDLRSRIKARLSSGPPSTVANSSTTTPNRAASDSDAKQGTSEYDCLVSEEARQNAKLLSLAKQAEAACSKNQRLKEQLRDAMQQRQQQQKNKNAREPSPKAKTTAW